MGVRAQTKRPSVTLGLFYLFILTQSQRLYRLGVKRSKLDDSQRGYQAFDGIGIHLQCVHQHPVVSNRTRQAKALRDVRLVVQVIYAWASSRKCKAKLWVAFYVNTPATKRYAL